MNGPQSVGRAANHDPRIPAVKTRQYRCGFRRGLRGALCLVRTKHQAQSTKYKSATLLQLVNYLCCEPVKNRVFELLQMFGGEHVIHVPILLFEVDRHVG